MIVPVLIDFQLLAGHAQTSVYSKHGCFNLIRRIVLKSATAPANIHEAFFEEESYCHCQHWDSL